MFATRATSLRFPPTLRNTRRSSINSARNPINPCIRAPDTPAERTDTPDPTASSPAASSPAASSPTAATSADRTPTTPNHAPTAIPDRAAAASTTTRSAVDNHTNTPCGRPPTARPRRDPAIRPRPPNHSHPTQLLDPDSGASISRPATHRVFS